MASGVDPRLFIFVGAGACIYSVGRSLIVVGDVLFALLLMILPLRVVTGAGKDADPISLGNLFGSGLRGSVIRSVPVETRVSNSRCLILDFRTPVVSVAVALCGSKIVIVRGSLSMSSKSARAFSLAL